MKYLEKGGFQQKPLMRLTLTLTFLFLSGFWASNWGMYLQRMSLDAESVVQYYNGNEETFKSPLTLGTMLETSHMHMPMMGMVLLFLTHLIIFVPFTKTIKMVLIIFTFVSAILDEGSGWLVRFIDPAFAPLKVIGFLGLQIAIGLLMVSIVIFLWQAAQQQKQEKLMEDEEIISAS